MAQELLYRGVKEHISTLIWDLLVFFVKSIYYILESAVLTFIPNRFRKIKDVSGQVVLITGGAGGVGKNLALKFAELNATVVVWDVNSDGVKSTIDFLHKMGLTCKGYVVDLTDKEAVYSLAEKVKADVGHVDILINNAGIVGCKTLLELSDKMIENTYAVNILSHYWTVRAFLPDMMKKKQGHIVTVGSVAGMLGTYACTDYSATKFACMGFHEALYTELRTHGYDNIHLTLVCPYYINTGMFAGVRPRLFPMLEPSYVADSIVRAVQKNEVNCVLPDSVRLFLPLKSWVPAKMGWELMARVMKGPNSMMLFKGRGKAQSG